MSPSWLGFTVTHLWKHDLYPLCFSLSRSWSSVASTGRWIKLQVKRSLFSSSNVSGPFAHGPALSPLSLSPCLLLLWCYSLHSSTLSVHLHVTMYQQERFPSDPARAKTALARAQWQTDDGAGGGWGGLNAFCGVRKKWQNTQPCIHWWPTPMIRNEYIRGTVLRQS